MKDLPSSDILDCPEVNGIQRYDHDIHQYCLIAKKSKKDIKSDSQSFEQKVEEANLWMSCLLQHCYGWNHSSLRLGLVLLLLSGRSESRV